MDNSSKFNNNLEFTKRKVKNIISLIDEIDKNRKECGIDEENGLTSNQIYQNKKIKNNINAMKNAALEILLINKKRRRETTIQINKNK